MPIRYGEGLDPSARPTYDELMSQLLAMLQSESPFGGMGERVAGGAETAILESLRGMSPEYMEDLFRTGYMPAQTRLFEEETIPGIREAMVGAGDFWSTGRANLETRARERFAERMESQLADLLLRGRELASRDLGVAPTVAGMTQQQALDRLRSVIPALNIPARVAYGEPRRDEGYAAGAGGRGGDTDVGMSQEHWPGSGISSDVGAGGRGGVGTTGPGGGYGMSTGGMRILPGDMRFADVGRFAEESTPFEGEKDAGWTAYLYGGEVPAEELPAGVHTIIGTPPPEASFMKEDLKGWYPVAAPTPAYGAARYGYGDVPARHEWRPGTKERGSRAWGEMRTV